MGLAYVWWVFDLFSCLMIHTKYQTQGMTLEQWTTILNQPWIRTVLLLRYFTGIEAKWVYFHRRTTPLEINMVGTKLIFYRSQIFALKPWVHNILLPALNNSLFVFLLLYTDVHVPFLHAANNTNYVTGAKKVAISSSLMSPDKWLQSDSSPHHKGSKLAACWFIPHSLYRSFSVLAVYTVKR